MTEERWLDLIARAKDKFDILEHQKIPAEEEKGSGEVEYICFNSPMGKIKLELTVKPLVLDKKTIGSRRIGSETTVEYIYSDTEKVRIFKIYRWDDNESAWTEIKTERGDFAL